MPKPPARAVVVLVWALSGCGAGGGVTHRDTAHTAARPAPTPLAQPGAVRDREGNDEFITAQHVELETHGQVVIQGRSEWLGDVDVYTFGPTLAGQHLLIEVEGDGTYVPAIALFNEDQTLWSIRPPAGAAGGTIAVTLPRSSDRLYLGLAADLSAGCCGEYGLHISSPRQGVMATPAAQTVLLNFSGAAAVVFGDVDPIDIPPFAAEMIDPSLKGLTEMMIATVTQVVQDDFAAFDVQIVSSIDAPPLSGGYSTVHYGSYQPGLLGLAERVDAFNQDRADLAVVFVDTFAAFMNLDPSPEELALALANVTSHEIGHLLGLVHAAGPRDLMDVSADLATLLTDRVFSRSPLDALVFPIGEQDSVSILRAVVGATTTETTSLRAMLERDDTSPGSVLRPVKPLSSGGCWIWGGP